MTNATGPVKEIVDELRRLFTMLRRAMMYQVPSFRFRKTERRRMGRHTASRVAYHICRDWDSSAGLEVRGRRDRNQTRYVPVSRRTYLLSMTKILNSNNCCLFGYGK